MARPKGFIAAFRELFSIYLTFLFANITADFLLPLSLFPLPPSHLLLPTVTVVRECVYVCVHPNIRFSYVSSSVLYISKIEITCAIYFEIINNKKKRIKQSIPSLLCYWTADRIFFFPIFFIRVRVCFTGSTSHGFTRFAHKRLFFVVCLFCLLT